MRVSGRILAKLLIVFALVTAVFVSTAVDAAQLNNRKLTLVGVGTTGGSAPGGTVNHAFAFTIPGGNSVGSIKFEYCTIAVGACTVPTGLVTSGGTVALSGESGVTGFNPAPVKPSNGVVYLTRTSASVGANVDSTYTLTNIVNPTTPNETFFVRISTYASTDTSGTVLDSGTVAASTTNQIQLKGIMPESLTFCTGGTISGNNCSNATSGVIDFDKLFSASDTAIATSQMIAATNAQAGYVITVNGNTLTSGTNTIDAMATAAASTQGIAQFGMNVVVNTTPIVGIAVSPSSNGSTHRAQGAVGYNTPNTFKFVSGDVIADSAYPTPGGTAGPTNAQNYTVSYIANVPGIQAAGTYTTTLTYICTPTF